MSPAPQLFRVNADNKTSAQVPEADFAALGLMERHDIQEWIAANPNILGDDLLIVAKEYDKFDWTNERLDLLAVDALGNLVIIELKRDDTGADVHTQAIKYASYLHAANAADIVGMLAQHAGVSQEDAEEKLLRHLDTGDFGSLNRNQRIIIASHRFAREVTSAVLWLNERMNDDVITCVQLTPYQDGGALYVQANTIIPAPGTEGYRIGLGGGSSGLQSTRINPDANDMRNTLIAVFHALNDKLADAPEKIHRAKAGGRLYLWHNREPWRNRECCYRVIFRRKSAPSALDREARDMVAEEWVAAIDLYERGGLPESVRAALREGVEGLAVDSYVQKHDNWTLLFGADDLAGDFVEKFAEMIRRYVELVTPLVDQAYERGEFGGDGDGEDGGIQ